MSGVSEWVDVSGHGESTGALSELSLRRRFEQAVGVIEARVPVDSPLVLVGFSMSGQTVADLAGHYGERVAALGLCAPAVYGAEAWDVPFGEGDGRFSELIRTPGSWHGALALDVLRAYEGRAVLVVPGADHIIPAEVTEAVGGALAARAQFTRLELADADHFLGLWLRDHPGDRRQLVRRGGSRPRRPYPSHPVPGGSAPRPPAALKTLVLTRRTG